MQKLRERVMFWVRARMREAAVWLLERGGPAPTDCLILRIDDGSKRGGRRVRLSNVRRIDYLVANQDTQAMLQITDLYGRTSAYRLDTVLSVRHLDFVPMTDIARGAVEVA